MAKKWHHRDQQEKGQIRKDQELLIGDVLNIQDSIWRGGRCEGGKDQVGTIWEDIRLEKHISGKGSK